MKRERTLTSGYLLPGTAALAILVAIVGCDPGEDNDDILPVQSDPASRDGAGRDSRINSAIAKIESASGSDVEGTVTFSISQDDREMQVTVDLSGLETGPHGLHVHEFSAEVCCGPP